MSGIEETPPVVTTATGMGTITMDTTANELQYEITFSGLSSAETNAHLHGFAPPGMSALPLPYNNLQPGSPKTGTMTYPEDDEDDLLNGLSYVNIHSGNFPNGEIRGQVDDPQPCAVEVRGRSPAGPGPALLLALGLGALFLLTRRSRTRPAGG
jgi:hypothetical protein